MEIDDSKHSRGDVIPTIAPEGEEKPQKKPRQVVGIGASAGGVEALSKLLADIEADSEQAFVVIQHLSPKFKSMLPDILSRVTRLKVKNAEDGELLVAGTVYVIPSRNLLTVFYGRLFLESRPADSEHCYFPIDYFFRSLAMDSGAKAIGIVLSGTGSDGTKGIQEIKKNAGHVIVQSHESAEFSGMPYNAISTNVADVVLPLGEMAEYLNDFSQGVLTSKVRQVPTPRLASALQKIFYMVRNQLGVDFTCYKPSIVERRVAKRQQMAKCGSLEEYADYLGKAPKELQKLFDDLLLGISGFHSDNQDPDSLKKLMFEPLVEAKQDNSVFRIWVVGAGTGEEAYGLAFSLADYLSSVNSSVDFKIFATDINEKALKIAGRGCYPAKLTSKFPEEAQKRYFRIDKDTATVRSYARERIVFARHDVTRDAPFPDIDLVVCRKVLIYMRQEVQAQIFSAFRFALKTQGFLLLGPGEKIHKDCDLAFKQLASDHQAYQCLGSEVQLEVPQYDSKHLKAKITEQHNLIRRIKEKQITDEGQRLRIYERIIKEQMVPSIVFNDAGKIEYLFGKVREFLLPITGKADFSLKESISVEVLETINGLKNSINAEHPEASEVVTVTLKNGKLSQLEITVADLDIVQDKSKLYLAKLVLLAQLEQVVTDDAKLDAFEKAKIVKLEKELKSTKAELENTRSELSYIIGQLEATNEELQTTNEELLAGSEELQSTNEELQAVNEELYTVNAECQLRISELAELSNDLDNISKVTEIGILFVDKSLRIRKYNTPLLNVIHLMPDDIGRPVEHLSSAFQVSFGPVIRDVLTNLKVFEEALKTKDGVWYFVRIAPYRAENLDIKGAVFICIEISSLQNIKTGKLTLVSPVDQKVLEGSVKAKELVVELTPNGSILDANEDYYKHFGANVADKSFFDTVAKNERGETLDRLSSWNKQSITRDTLEQMFEDIDGNQTKLSWQLDLKRDRDGKLKQITARTNLN